MPQRHPSKHRSFEPLEDRRLFVIMHMAVLPETPTRNEVTGVVFLDKDGNGKRTDRLGEADQGIAGTRVYIDANDNARFDKGEWTGTTNVNGGYVLAGWPDALLGKPVRTSLDGGRATTRTLTLKHHTAIDLGITKPMPTATIVTGAPLDPGLLTEKIWFDHRTELPGVRIYLDLNLNAKIDRGEPRYTTDGSNRVTFANLYPGKYRLRTQSPAGFQASSRYIDVRIGDREQRTRTFTFGGRRTLGFQFFVDADNDGIRDAGEVDLPVVRNLNDLEFDQIIDPRASTPESTPLAISLHLARQRHPGAITWIDSLPSIPLKVNYMRSPLFWEDTAYRYEELPVIPYVSADLPSGSIVYLPVPQFTPRPE